MMSVLKNPAWIDYRLLSTNQLDRLPQSLLNEIKDNLRKFQSPQPLVSIVVPACNEEFSVLRTLHSLSCNETKYPVEVIVINNNSTDRTQQVLDLLGVRSFFQPVAGWGPARQLGLEKAMGKYVLSADCDSFYPPNWIQTMTDALVDENIACVYGDYSYLGNETKARWKFAIYETLRNIILEVRQIKRPFLNARGLNMGFVRELALKKGYIYAKVRGEDGRMCFDLMQHGRIKRIRSRNIVVWTPPRAKGNIGLVSVFFKNTLIELSKMKSYFYKRPMHDTHTSPNSAPPVLKYMEKIKHNV